MEEPQVAMSCSTVPSGTEPIGASSRIVRQFVSWYLAHMSIGGGFSINEGRGGAEGGAGGPRLTPGKGPTSRTDVAIAAAAVIAVVGVVLVLVLG